MSFRVRRPEVGAKPTERPVVQRERHYPFDFTRQELQTVGARIEDRREAIGLAVLDLCRAAGIPKQQYRAKLEADGGAFFSEGEITRIREFLHAPGRWPLERADDSDRVGELKQALLTANAKKEHSLGPCPHAGGTDVWCRACVELRIAEGEARALARALDAARKLEAHATEGDLAKSSTATKERIKAARVCRATFESMYQAAVAALREEE